MKRRPKGYWSDLSNVLVELAPICKKLGYLPGHRDLIALGLSSLARYGYARHGGSQLLATKLGYKTLDQLSGKHERDYWSFETTVAELISFIKTNNFKHFPTKADFVKHSKLTLRASVVMYGTRAVKEDPKVIALGLGKKVKSAAWSEERVIGELRELVDRYGYFPSQGHLDKIGAAALRGAIAKLGGHEYFWNVLGKPSHKTRQLRSRADLKDDKIILARLAEIQSMLGHFPSGGELTELRETWLIRALKELRERRPDLKELGEDAIKAARLLKTNDGHLVRSTYEAIFDNILHMLNVAHETEGKISVNSQEKYMYDFKLRDLRGQDVYVEIWGYIRESGNGWGSARISAYKEKRLRKRGMYERLNLRLLEIDGAVFDQSLPAIYVSLTEALTREGVVSSVPDYEPEQLVTALAYKVYRIEELLVEVCDVGEALGHFPTADELRSVGKAHLVDRVLKVGGFSVVKKMTSLASKQKVRKWTKETVINELCRIRDVEGSFPTLKNIFQARPDLYGGISRNGGSEAFANFLSLSGREAWRERPLAEKEVMLRELENSLTPDGRIPSKAELLRSGQKELALAIEAHGGFVKAAIGLGLELSNPKYADPDYFWFVAKRIVDKYCGIPATSILRREEPYFYQALLRTYGGVSALEDRFHLKQKRLRNQRAGPWSLSDIHAELMKLSESLGKFPSMRDLPSLGRADLFGAISRNGGMKEIRRKLKLAQANERLER